MGEQADLDRVRSVLERHRSEITARYTAVGTGIGKWDPADVGYVITVYLALAADLPATSVEVEGVPLQFVVTGEFHTQVSEEGDR